MHHDYTTPASTDGQVCRLFRFRGSLGSKPFGVGWATASNHRTNIAPQCGKVKKGVKKLLGNLVGQGKRAIALRNGCDSKERVRADTRRKTIKVLALPESFSLREDSAETHPR
jgi:hypothetical protein